MIKNKQTNYMGVEKKNKIENIANPKLADGTKDEPKARV